MSTQGFDELSVDLNKCAGFQYENMGHIMSDLERASGSHTQYCPLLQICCMCIARPLGPS